MKVGERGQVTIPKEIRERFGIGPDTEVEFKIEGGRLLLRKRAPELPLRKWKGYCATAFRKAGHRNVDEYLDTLRGKL